MVIKQKAIILPTSQYFLNPLLTVVKKIKTETLIKERKLSLGIKVTSVNRKIPVFKFSQT